MANKPAVQGGRKPQVDIPIDLLELDADNPRLARDSKGVTQLDLLSVLYEEFDVEELAYSMAENGYFDEEPLVVVPKSLPKNFNFNQDTDKQEEALQKLVKDQKIKFTVIEGNRRTATLKLLIDSSSRKTIGVTSDFPKPSSVKIANDLKEVPAIVYFDREAVNPYLGVRHISGPKKWDFYPRVLYVSKRIEELKVAGKSYQTAIQETQKQIASRRSDTVTRLYLYYRVTKIVEDDLDFDIEPVLRNFSLLEVAFRSPGIRQYIGLGDDSRYYKNINFEKRVLPPRKVKELEQVLTWIYGNKRKKIQPLIHDSRQIPTLGQILLNSESRDFFIKTGDFDGAYERSSGEEELLRNRIMEARRKLETAMSIAYKDKNKSKELIVLVDECIEAAEELRRILTKR